MSGIEIGTNGMTVTSRMVYLLFLFKVLHIDVLLRRDEDSFTRLEMTCTESFENIGNTEAGRVEVRPEE